MREIDRIEHNPLLIAESLRVPEWAEGVKDYMQDDELDQCLDLVLKVISKPNVPQQQVAVLIAQLSALAVKFRLMFSGYMSYLKGTDEANMKKNHYKEMYTGIDNLVDALKYLIK